MTVTHHVKSARRDIENTADVERLVNAFYDKALADPDIGFFFTDVANVNLAEHLPKMYGFWSALILGTPTYRRNAFLPHAALAEKHPIEAHHFARWLALFFATIDAHFEGPKAELAKQRARHIATAMAGKLAAQETQEYSAASVH